MTIQDNGKSLDNIVEAHVGDPDKFYIVWRNGSRHNIDGMRKHKIIDDAEDEARRLCEKFPDKYFVLEVVACVAPGPAKIKRM